MKEFANLKDFIRYLEGMERSYERYEYKAITVLGSVLVENAKHKIGWLQHGAGPFERWEPLAESTKTDKEKKGYVFNSDYNPLFREGDLRDSISYVFNPGSKNLYLGSNSDIMIYQEFGTIYIPPRSVIGLTMFVDGVIESKYIFQKMLDGWAYGKPLSTVKK